MFALFVGIAFLFVGNGLIISSAGGELKKMGADELQTGLVIATYFIGAMAGTIFSHRIVSRVGYIRSFGIFASLFGIAVYADDFFLAVPRFHARALAQHQHRQNVVGKIFAVRAKV